MGNIILPAIQQQYSSSFSSDAATTAQWIQDNYGTIVQSAANSVGMDPNIAIVFMIIESGTGNGTVNPNAKSPAGAIGLLQLEPTSAWQALANQAPAFTPDQAAIVDKYLPGFRKVGGFVGLLSSWSSNIATALVIPEFNIYVGIIQLAQLFKYIIRKAGTLDLAQVVIAYNAGQGNYNSLVYNKGLQNSDTTTLVADFPYPETTNYIIKLLGIGGSLLAAIGSTPPASSDTSDYETSLVAPTGIPGITPTTDSSGITTF